MSEPLSKYLCMNCLRAYHFLEPPAPEELEDRRSILSQLPYAIGIYAARTFVPESVIQSMIHHFKYRDMPRLAKVVASDVAGSFEELAKFTDVILPVPLHVTRNAERGYNQSELLARQLAKIYGIGMDAGSLRRIKPTPSQTGLSFSKREENVRGAFKLTKHGIRSLKGKRLLVVDDVITTGATMASIGSELAQLEPKHVGFFALAAAQFGI